MEGKVLRQGRTIYKINFFYLGVLIWSILVQFFPIPFNAYQYVSLLIPISIYLFINKEHGERILKPNLLNLKSIIIIIAVWTCMLPIIVTIINIYTKLFGNTIANIIAEDSNSTFIGNLIFTAITPAILEETLMRGIILDGYRYKSRFVAAIMNGFMFGMLHLNSFQFFHTFVAGFVASYLVFATNSIYAGMIIHFINNSFPIFIDYLYPPNPNVDYASNPSLFTIIMSIVFSILVVHTLIRLLAKINNIDFSKKEETSDEKIFNKPLIISIFLFIAFSIVLISLL